jgi:hypothetical protein
LPPDIETGADRLIFTVPFDDAAAVVVGLLVPPPAAVGVVVDAGGVVLAAGRGAAATLPVVGGDIDRSAAMVPSGVPGPVPAL